MRDTQDTEKEVGIIWWLLLGLCCFVAVPLVLLTWHQRRTKIPVATTTMQMMAYQRAITNFKRAKGRWPSSLPELETNKVGLVFIATSNHIDPWSRPYIFVPYHSTTGFGRIISFGRDGKPGGTGLDADIERRFPDPGQGAFFRA